MSAHHKRLAQPLPVRQIRYGGCPMVYMRLPSGERAIMAADIAYVLGRKLVRSALAAKLERRLTRKGKDG